MTAIDISSCPRTSITVQGQILDAPQPFAEGHVLRPNEAAVLNQTYAENLRNNFASGIKKLVEEAKKAGTEPDFSNLQAKFDEYVQTYDFGVRRAGGGAVTLDPVSREAMRLAREAVLNALKAKGISQKEAGKEKIAELSEQVFESNKETLLARAKQIIELKSGVAGEITV